MSARPSDDALYNLLQTHLEPDSLEYVSEILEPFYQRVQEGTYPLKPQSELDPVEIQRTIARATGREVKEVVLISLRRMNRKICQEILGQNFGHSLRCRLAVSLSDSFWKRFGDGRAVNIRIGLSKYLEYSLKIRLGETLRTNIWDSLFFFLGFALAGEIGKAVSLEPLVRLLLDCIPLGWKKGEDVVCIVICG